MKNKEHGFFNNILFFIAVIKCSIIKIALAKRFFTTPTRYKSYTNVDRKHIRCKICDDVIAIGYSADMILENKNH